MLRRVRVLAVVLGVSLIPVAVAAFSLQNKEHGSKQATLDRALTQAVGSQSTRLTTYFGEAQKFILIGAQESAFGAFYTLPGSSASKLRAGGRVVDKINADLAYFERLYPDAIGEACFIERAGPEIARIVHGKRAPIGDLSPDESGNPFFNPTFTLRPGEVYQARPYLSPDTHDWVISNSTLLPNPAGPAKALVHFEVTIESFRRQAARDGGRFDVSVIDGRTGAVVFDSAQPQRPGGKLGRPGDRRFAALTSDHGGAGVATLDGRRVAYQHVPRIQGNANDWWAIVSAPPLAGGLHSLELAPVVLMAGALLLFACLVAALFFVRRLSRRVAALVAASEAAAAGDLTARAPADGRDELARLGRAFNGMVEALADLVAKIAGASNEVSKTSREVAERSQSAGQAVAEITRAVSDVAQGAERQVRMVGEATATADEVVSAVSDSAESASRTAEAAAQARAVAQDGVASAEQATQAIDAVRSASDSVIVAIKQLAARSAEIGGIVETITGIAGQTNLLALNAAIEAARAGEQGRGFAVVAEEVRKLAEESARAAALISKLIEEIQQETQQTVGLVDDAAKRTADGAAIVEQTREAFLSIGRAVEDVGVRVDEIAAATRQIADGAAKMHEDMNEVAAVAEQSSASSEQVSASSQETSASTQQISASAQELAGTAEELERLVNQFKLTA